MAHSTYSRHVRRTLSSDIIRFIPVRNAGSFLMEIRFQELADADRTSFGTPPKCPLLRGLNWKV